jgi:signal transduction histidine kinase
MSTQANPADGVTTVGDSPAEIAKDLLAIGRIQQVVSNLLGNALLHGSPSTPVKLRVTRGESDLIVEVHNQGDPIPPESIDKLFQPFWRRSTSASRKGLGLGLYICSQIVAAHKGRIQVKSAQEDGTRFTVHLPVA